jgi:hypothetical protein
VLNSSRKNVFSAALNPQMRASLTKMQSRMFSHGPYNPLAFKNYTMPEDLPT